MHTCIYAYMHICMYTCVCVCVCIIDALCTQHVHLAATLDTQTLEPLAGGMVWLQRGLSAHCRRQRCHGHARHPHCRFCRRPLLDGNMHARTHTQRGRERERERERDVAISLNRTHVAASHLKSHPCDDVLLVGAARCLLSVVPGVCCVSHCACARACVPSASASPLRFPSSSPPRSRSAFPLRSCSSTPRSRFASPMRSSSFPRRS